MPTNSKKRAPVPRRRALRLTSLVLVTAVGLLGAPPASAARPSPLERARAAAAAAVQRAELPPVTGSSLPAPGTGAPSAAPTLPAASPEAAAALRRRVDSALASSGARTVAVAIDVDGVGPLVRRESDHPLPPASTQKTFTALTALLALGPDRRLRTEVASPAVPVDGRLSGSLWLVAGGDPFLTGSGLARLAQDLRAAGITTVDGDVRLDDSRYDSARRAPGWARSYVPSQAGPLSAMALDRNRWRTDAAFLADPALPAAGRFRDALTAAGIRVTGSVRRDIRPPDASTLAVLESAPVSTLVSRTLKASDNFAAELLLKEVGRQVRGVGSSAAGVQATRDVLAPLGVPVGTAADGSGLSSIDRQTTAGQLLLLRAAARSPVAAQLRDALPRGCADGTLRRRFCGTPAAGRVSAKTGTLSGIRTLSGYTETRSGRPVRFAFQLSGVPDGGRALAAIDRAVVVLASATE